MHYQPGENAGGLQDTVWLCLWHLEESPWTRHGFCSSSALPLKSRHRYQWAYWALETDTSQLSIVLEFVQGVTHTPRKPYRQLCMLPFLWVHITDQSRRCLLDRWRLEPLWDSEGGEGIGFWFPVLRMLNTITPLECQLLTAYWIQNSKGTSSISASQRYSVVFKRMQAPLLQKKNPRDRETGPPPGAAEASPGQERLLQSPSVIASAVFLLRESHC